MLYEVTLFGTYYNQRVVNRWNYISSGTPAASLVSLLLLKGMGFIEDNGTYPPNTVFSTVRGLQTDQMFWNTVSARAIYDDVDFYETPFVPAAPGISGENNYSAPYDSIGFRTSRVRQDIGRGYKRIGGIPDNWIVNGGDLSATAEAAALACANEMSDVITVDDEGNTVSFTPCVVKKEKYAVPNTNPVRYAYRYYEVEATQMANIAAGIVWEFYPTTRTQTSRQYGRGR